MAGNIVQKRLRFKQQVFKGSAFLHPYLLFQLLYNTTEEDTVQYS